MRKLGVFFAILLSSAAAWGQNLGSPSGDAVGNITCAQLPALTGGATSSAGSCTTALTPATSSTLGGVKPDGTTITNSAGAISVTYGTTSGTAAQGNDSRITGAAQQTTASFTPIANGFNIVGTPTYTGTIIKTGTTILLTITVSSTTTSAAVAGTSNFTNIPLPAVSSAIGGAFNYGTGISYGGASVILSGGVGYLYVPTWGATGSNVIVTVSYQTAS